MSRDQVTKALKAELEGDAFDNDGSCIELFPVREDLKGTYFMFLDGKLSRISVVEAGRIGRRAESTLARLPMRSAPPTAESCRPSPITMSIRRQNI